MTEKVPVIEIFPFDFSDEKLILEAINLLNEGTEKKKHTPEFWEWRFSGNPFGESLGWYAREMISGDLAGILLWWPWRFISENQEKLFYQAINGKTASRYRNLKIFYSLNSIAIQHFQEINIGLFGYANENSYPNYRNTGWKLLTRVHPILIPVSPIRSLMRLFLKSQSLMPEASDPEQIQFFFHNHEGKNENQIKTNWDNRILSWRFFQHPVHKYSYFYKNESLIIFRIKKRRKLKEAQIVFSDLAEKSDYHDFVGLLKRQHFDIMSYFGFNSLLSEILKRKLFRFTMKKDLYFIVNDTEFLRNKQLRFEMAEADSQ